MNSRTFPNSQKANLSLSDKFTRLGWQNPGRVKQLAICLICASVSSVIAYGVQGNPLVAPAAPNVLIFSLGAEDLAGFDQNAAIAKESGATHMVITDHLPLATWQMTPPGDPYPAWYIHQPDFLKLFPPAELRPYVDLEYAEKVSNILEARCKILRKHGLKAFWRANAPQVLPEAFFTDHPELRGPRVDQPNRSRIARFSPCVDKPETLRLYREGIKNLLERCPEVEIMSFLTTDSGSGFCWVPGLYPGANGPAWCRETSMADRVSSFLLSLQQAARETGHDVAIDIHQIKPRQWMIPSFPSPFQIVRELPAGLALNGLEGPDGSRFMSTSGAGGWRAPFYPVVGIAVPDLLAEGTEVESTRKFVNFGDLAVQDYNLRIYRATSGSNDVLNQIDRLIALREFAAEDVGEALADDVLSMWTALSDVDRRLDTLNFGPVFRMGHMLARWINRPMVPFPEELSSSGEKSYYRPYLFQAKGEEQADNLIDIQAMRMYEGWGAKMLFQRVVETAMPNVKKATQLAQHVRDNLDDEAKKREWDILSKRLEAVECLLASADHMVAYQAHLDRVKSLGVSPESNPPLGAQPSWDRSDIMQIARNEIDNVVRLRQIILSTNEAIIETAATPDDEAIMMLSPSLPEQLKRKIDIMNAHWSDYDRLYTVPNP